jgi:two-component system OmpR family sensor kinase
LIAYAPANLATSPDAPSLTTQEYRSAASNHPRPYYIATAADGSTSLVVLNVIRNGARPIALAQLSIATDDIDRTLSLDRDVAVIGSVSVLLLALLLSPLIIGRALRPLKQMSDTAGKLAAGDYKQRVTVPKASDEIGTLAVAFNQMAAGIDHAFEVRRRSEEQMRHFVADASHELRTPLTSIAGYIDVLGRRDVVDAETLQTSLAAMQQESARMTRLVNDLLTLTRFESGKPTTRRPVMLDQFVNQALDELSLTDKGAVESRDLQPGVTVTADPEALKQVVTNLAQNALKYAPGAEQHWSVFQEDGRAAIRLQDAGPGISRQDLPHIFERFYRGEKARDRSTGGSGLGLAIARSIVEAHQGTIEAASEPGKGATFTAWLPLAA